MSGCQPVLSDLPWFIICLIRRSSFLADIMNYIEAIDGCSYGCGMRIRLIFLVLGVILSGCVTHRELPAPPVLAEGPLSIVVDVKGVKCCEGVLRLAVYNDKGSWMSPSNMVRGRLGFIQGDEQTFEIHGLPAGDYAIAVYQDTNSNNKLDRWLWTVPREPYGFSNNVGRYGPVSFDKAAFGLSEDLNISIELNSW